MPVAAGRYPLVVYLPGGGFVAAPRAMARRERAFIAAAGHAVASVEYRTTRRHATYRDGLADVGAAIDHLVSNADAYGIDAARMAVWGESAGGYLASMAGLTDPRIRAVVDEFTGKVRVHGLRAGERTYYRVRVEGDHGRTSEPLTGSLRIPGRHDGDPVRLDRRHRRPGLGHQPRHRRHADLRRDAPAGARTSTCAAATPSTPTARSPRRSRCPTVGPGATSSPRRRPRSPRRSPSTAASTRTTCSTRNLRAFAAEVPQVNQWDDHEVTNNWYPGEILDDPRYTEKRVDVLAARARRAFYEWLPITRRPTRCTGRSRTGRCWTCSCWTCAPTRTRTTATRTPTRGRGLLGDRAARVADPRPASTPGRRGRSSPTTCRSAWSCRTAPTAQEGVAQGDPGAPLGRELEFAADAADRAPAPASPASSC